jgi:hypothetical protein
VTAHPLFGAARAIAARTIAGEGEALFPLAGAAFTEAARVVCFRPSAQNKDNVPN